MPREPEEWERCADSTFTGAHVWLEDLTCNFCGNHPDRKHYAKVREQQAQLKIEREFISHTRGKLELK